MINLILFFSNNYNMNSMNIIKNTFFKLLYNNLKKIIKTTNIDKKHITFTLCNDKPNKYLESNDFMSDNIIEYINTKLLYCYKVQYENNEIIFFTNKKYKHIPTIINKIIFIIVIIKRLFYREKYPQKCIFFETNKKKQLPKEKNMILNSDNINSALTYLEFTKKNGDIILYRKEECIKVLIHEMIHSNLIDKKIIYSKISNDFSNNFCSNYKTLLNESFTETFACIINIFIISIIKKMNVNEMFKNECIHSNIVCNRIKNYYGLDCFKSVIKMNNSCSNHFKQKTNIISYYFLKNILLHHYIEFGNLIEKYNTNYKIINDKFNNELCKLLLKYIDEIDNRKSNSDKSISLRMSFYSF